MAMYDDNVDEDAEADDAAAEEREVIQRAASDRVSYDLHFKRAETPRVFDVYELTGDDIDDAFNPPGERSAGSWDCPHFFSMMDMNENAWFQEFFSVAVTEAVHESLEWFRVDGRLVINPHGKNQDAIMLETAAFARELWRKYGKAEYSDVQGTCYGQDLSKA